MSTRAPPPIKIRPSRSTKNIVAVGWLPPVVGTLDAGGVAAPPTFDAGVMVETITTGVGVDGLVVETTMAVGVSVLVAGMTIGVAVDVAVGTVVTGAQMTLKRPGLLRFSVIGPAVVWSVTLPPVMSAVPLLIGVGRLKAST